MFGLRTTEILIILAVVLLLFGARRLPELGKSLGSALRGFKKSVSGEDEDARAELPPAGKEPATRDGPGSR